MNLFLKSLAIAALLIAMLVPAKATSMSKEEIAQLPQDRVNAIRQYCAQRWANEYSMRIWCEDKEYQALKALLARGSLQ
jgi:hypothetical protein